MPISRYRIRNAHGLADPELIGAADKDDSEALLEAVAMTGLVGFLRQLGDLAQFAAELFHDLHEEVMATAERGHSLMSRVQQLEAEIPPIEKAFLSRTHHSSFFTNGGIDWCPNLRSEQNLITRGDLPRFIMDSYEECRAPPRLFLLDKFDVAGAGACLKRYTDPSFFKAEPASSATATVEVHRERKIRKVKPKKGEWLRDGEAPGVVPSHSKLHQLFLEERIENACSDPARLVNLKKRQLDGSAVESKSGRSYMEKFLEIPSPNHKMVCETSVIQQPVKLMSGDTSETGIKKLGINGISPMGRSMENGKTHSSSNEQELELNSCAEMDRRTNRYLVKEPEQIFSGRTGTDEMYSKHLKVPDETEPGDDDEQNKRECSPDGYHSDDAASEVDDYMDALATIDSELEIDNECRPKESFLNVQKVTDSNGDEEHQLQAQFSDSQSFGDSSLSEEMSLFEQDRSEEHNEVQARLPGSWSGGTPGASDDNSSFKGDRNQEHTQLQVQFSDSQSIGNSSPETENMSSNQLPQIVELQKTGGEFVTNDDTHDQGRAISDSRPVSSGSCLDSECLLSYSDHGPTATSLASLPTRTQSDETLHVPVECHLRLQDDKEALSPIKDNTCPVVYFDNNSSNNLDVSDHHVHSNTLLQVSDELNLAHEGKCGDLSHIETLQADSLNEYCSEISVVGDIGSRGEDPICLPMEIDLNSGTKLLLDVRDLKPNDDIKTMQLDSEGFYPVVESSVENSFTEELCSDFTHGNPRDGPDSAEFEFLYPDQLSRINLGDEINGSTCSLGPVEDDNCIKHSASPDYILQDDNVMVNGMVPVEVQSKDLDVSAIPSLDNAEPDASIASCLASNSISSPSMNPSNLHESFLGSSDSHTMEMESNEVELTKNSTDLNAEKKESQPEPFSYITSPVSSLTKLEESPSTFEDPHEKNMEVNEEVARDSLTELKSHIEMGQLEIASIDERLNLNGSVTSDSSICNNYQHSLLKEKIQDGSSPNDMKMVTQCSELDTQRSECTFVFQIDLQNSKDRFLPPSYNQPQPESHIEFASEVHPGERSHGSLSMSSDQKISPTKHVMDSSKPLLPDLFPKAAKINLEETPPMPPLPPMQWIMNKVQNASPDSQREEICASPVSFQPIQPVTPDYKSQFGLSTSERVTFPYQNPFLPVVAVDSNESLQLPGISAGISEHPVAIPLQYPVMVNGANGQHNYLVQERSQIYNPFLTLPLLSYGGLPHGCVIASEGESILKSSPCPPILPAERAFNGDNPIYQQERLYQFTSQLMEDTRLEAKKDSNGESVLSSSLWPPILPAECAVYGTNPIFQQEKSSQFTSQLMEDTSLEAKKDGGNRESILNSSPFPPILPSECAVPGSYPIFQQDKLTNSASQIMEDAIEAKKNSPGELHSVLSGECHVSGEDPISPEEQHSHSPNQFMEETVLEFTTHEESSIDLERDQGDHLISPESPPSTEVMHPNHSLLPPEGNRALSLDTSSQSSEFDSQIPNGKPKKKLLPPPPPQNHLFDVAAALDKSRLRKVTDRVRPQIAPKVDDRDSLLEQIRTKSFNLRTAVVTRPNIQGPKTNLRVAAILEKANSIRQALAGSDEDDDADSWSDS
ncbi:protein SCAR2-like isoform X2 [Trifolium pratense]|uniref:protein SCAR2-like isoform X2 n=1 Tax=Trifolium pratense TaxID=57577 RepID=UPI001E694C80|nr:protein SCAR2-like isoform X2 [Trifolium pratense]